MKETKETPLNWVDRETKGGGVEEEREYITLRGIETPVLKQIKGHSKESTFLSYIGTKFNKDTYADALMRITATL